MINYIKRESKLWEWVKYIFPNVDLDGAYFTFGRNIYTPGYISDDLVIHEVTHVAQQKGSFIYATWWWIKYILYPEFRYKQELEAYTNQMMFILNGIKDRNQRFKVQTQVAKALSSPMYNNMVTYQKAFEDLKNRKTKRYE